MQVSLGTQVLGSHKEPKRMEGDGRGKFQHGEIPEPQAAAVMLRTAPNSLLLVKNTFNMAS